MAERIVFHESNIPNDNLRFSKDIDRNDQQEYEDIYKLIQESMSLSPEDEEAGFNEHIEEVLKGKLDFLDRELYTNYDKAIEALMEIYNYSLLSDNVLGMMKKNLSIVSSEMSTKDTLTGGEGLEILFKIAGEDDDSGTSYDAKEIILKNFEKIASLYNFKEDDYYSYYKGDSQQKKYITSKIFCQKEYFYRLVGEITNKSIPDHYSLSFADKILDIPIEYWDKNEIKIIDNLVTTYDKSGYNTRENKVLSVIKKRFNLEPNEYMEIRKAWCVSQKAELVNYNIFDNLSKMMEMEDQYPGLPKVLFNEFGIRVFNRYTMETLLELCDNKDKDNIPYGIIIQPINDWNGAFEQPKLIDELNSDLKGKYYLRIFECSDKLEIAKALGKLARRYQAHKISFAIIGGHGTKTSIQFGKRFTERDILHLEDFTDPRMLHNQSYFEQNPTIILKSCSTGKFGGIAQKLSETFNAQVIAPTLPTSIKKININFDENGKVKFDVEYHKKGRNKKAVYQPNLEKQI